LPLVEQGSILRGGMIACPVALSNFVQKKTGRKAPLRKEKGLGKMTSWRITTKTASFSKPKVAIGTVCTQKAPAKEAACNFSVVQLGKEPCSKICKGERQTSMSGRESVKFAGKVLWKTKGRNRTRSGGEGRTGPAVIA